MTCPHCQTELPGLGTYCHACGRYTDEGGGGSGGGPAKDPGLSESPPAPREWSVTIPWDCMVSVNKRSGGMAGWTTKEYRDKRDAMTAVIANEYDGGPHSGEVFVAIELYPPDNRSDPHNFTKAVFDALEHAGVIENDKLITRWEGTRFYVDKDNPRAYVRVEKRQERAA